MKQLIAAMLLALLSGSTIAASLSVDIPEGVVLVPATSEAKIQAVAMLGRLLESRSPKMLSGMLGDVATQKRPGFMLGTFSSQDVGNLPGFTHEKAAFGHGVLQLTRDVPFNYRLIGAGTADQRDYLAAQLLRTLPLGAPDSIRPATFDELAQIWNFIGWDLNEPLLIAEWSNQRFVFNFDNSGKKITWVERLSDPCFKLATEDKVLLDCHCITIERDGAHWKTSFVAAKQTNVCKK